VRELTLQLVEDVVASRAPASPRPVLRDALLPRLERATTLDEVELAIHDVAKVAGRLGDTLVAAPDGPNTAPAAVERIIERMLSMQDALEQDVVVAADAMAARKALVAHETLRRLFALALRDAPDKAARADVPAAVVPSVRYLSDVALRLALLVAAIEHGVHRRTPLIAAVAQRAFETSQTLRRAARELGLDLTPWSDAPAAIRAKRVVDAAKVFWGSLNAEQQRTVDDAWGERVELATRWPLPSS
jgi:hypothetical protein